VDKGNGESFNIHHSDCRPQKREKNLKNRKKRKKGGGAAPHASGRSLSYEGSREKKDYLIMSKICTKQHTINGGRRTKKKASHDITSEHYQKRENSYSLHHTAVLRGGERVRQEEGNSHVLFFTETRLAIVHSVKR